MLHLLLAGAYLAPAECPDESAFHAAIAKRAVTSTVGLSIEITGRGDRVMGTLTLDGTSRVVEGDDCPEVIEALALVASLLLEAPPAVSAPMAESEPLVPLGALSSAMVARSTPTPRVPPRRYAWSAGAQGGASVGVVPGLGLGVPVFVQLDVGSRAVRLSGRWVESRAEPSVGAASFSQLGVKLEGCPGAATLGAGFTLAGCAALEGGVLLASAEGVEASQSVAQLWAAGGGLLRLAYFGLDPFFVEVEAGAQVPFTRPRFLFDPGLVVHDVAPITGSFALGGGLRFW